MTAIRHLSALRRRILHIYIACIAAVSRRNLFFIGAIAAVAVALIATRPVVAQGLGSVIETLKEKIGFGYDPDLTDYVFSKDTPNYRAFAGAAEPFGAHKILLSRDDSSLELQFISADTSGRDVLGDSVSLTPDQLDTLNRAEDVLLREASASAEGRLPLPPELRPTDTERQLIASAAAIIGFEYPVPDTEASGSATATESARPALLLEAQDFALLLAVKDYRIRSMALDVDLKLADIKKNVSSLVSHAALVEEPGERVVRFDGITRGLTIDYRLVESGIRQQIVVTGADNPYTTFRFGIVKHGLIPEPLGGGVWYFRTLKNERIMRVPKAWASDASGKFTNSVEIKIGRVRDLGEVMTVIVSPEWLTAPERVYPVIVETALEIVPEIRHGKPGYKPPKHVKGSSQPTTEPTAVPTAVPTLRPTVTVPEASGSAAIGTTPTPETIPTEVPTLIPEPEVPAATPSGSGPQASDSGTAGEP